MIVLDRLTKSIAGLYLEPVFRRAPGLGTPALSFDVHDLRIWLTAVDLVRLNAAASRHGNLIINPHVEHDDAKS